MVAVESVDRPIAEEDVIIELRSLVDELDALGARNAPDARYASFTQLVPPLQKYKLFE